MVLAHKEHGVFALADPARPAARDRGACRSWRAARPCSCRCRHVRSRRARPRTRPDAPDRPRRRSTAAPRRADRSVVARLLEVRGTGAATRPGSTPANGPPTWPARWRVRPAARTALAAGRRTGLRGGLRRRADHRCHRPRGTACPRGGRSPGPCRGDGRRDPQATAGRKCTTRPGPTAFGTWPTNVCTWRTSGSAVSSGSPGRAVPVLGTSPRSHTLTRYCALPARARARAGLRWSWTGVFGQPDSHSVRSNSTGGLRWMSWSAAGTVRCRTGSGSMSRRSSPGWRSTTTGSSGWTCSSRRRPALANLNGPSGSS